MTARQTNTLNWIALSLTLAGAGGTGVWWAATLSAKVDTMRDDITYIKERIDGKSPAVAASAAVDRERTAARR